MLLTLTIKRVLCTEILTHQQERSVQNHPNDCIKLMHNLKRLLYLFKESLKVPFIFILRIYQSRFHIFGNKIVFMNQHNNTRISNGVESFPGLHFI